MKYIIILFLTILTGRSYGQYDTAAIAILDSMSSQIDELETCSFRFYSEFDISNDEYGLITHSESGNVFLKGPDKMFVDKEGDKGHRVFYYNGKTFLLYSYDKNLYATAPAEISIIELIDSLSSYFGVEFPGADIFYPDFVDDLLETSNNLVFLGITAIGDKECYHIAGSKDDMTYQLWVTDDEYPILVKLSINYITKPGNPRYTMFFKDWKLNENIDDSKFEFTIPEGAELVKLVK